MSIDWPELHFCKNCGETRILAEGLCGICNAYGKVIVNASTEEYLVARINSAGSIEDALKAVNELAKLKKKG